ncbi:MAG: hypothetical protein OXT09_32015 [Myxococcales bacterium]|nr:hypothetical protein [Myxococcales bacterium]
MNFFGHALAALTHDDDPHFVLGAMLPDFAPMAGARIAEVREPTLAGGVAHHHETDRRFHANASFIALCKDALTQLTAAGCSRASARAVGHVGSELLLDGLLSRDREARAVYGRALRLGVDHHLARSIEWQQGEAQQLHRLLVRLEDAPVPEAYEEPAFVADRLQHILKRRPRLALQPQDQPHVQAWLTRARECLEGSHHEILQALR